MQHRFTKSVLHTGARTSAAQVQAVAGIFGIKGNVSEILSLAEKWFGHYLRNWE